MPNTITGVIAVIDPKTTITARSGNQYDKQTLLLDCTRHDAWTGARSEHVNIVPLTFFGKSVGDIAALHKGDVVTVSFTIEGRTYTDRTTGQQRYIAEIRPYKAERIKSAELVLAERIATQNNAADGSDAAAAQSVQSGQSVQSRETTEEGELPF